LSYKQLLLPDNNGLWLFKRVDLAGFYVGDKLPGIVAEKPQ
jgi:hypothetical protein